MSNQTEKKKPKLDSGLASKTTPYIRLLKAKEDLTQELHQISLSAFAQQAPWQEAQLTSILQSDHVLTLLVEEKKEVLAFMVLGLAGDQAEVYQIAVAKPHQRRGLASLLMTDGLRHLLANGVSKLFLEVRASNRPAQLFYKRQGFALQGYRKNYYHNPKEDALVLALNLNGKRDGNVHSCN